MHKRAPMTRIFNTFRGISQLLVPPLIVALGLGSPGISGHQSTAKAATSFSDGSFADGPVGDPNGYPVATYTNVINTGEPVSGQLTISSVPGIVGFIPDTNTGGGGGGPRSISGPIPGPISSAPTNAPAPSTGPSMSDYCAAGHCSSMDGPSTPVTPAAPLPSDTTNPNGTSDTPPPPPISGTSPAATDPTIPGASSIPTSPSPSVPPASTTSGAGAALSYIEATYQYFLNALKNYFDDNANILTDGRSTRQSYTPVAPATAPDPINDGPYHFQTPRDSEGGQLLSQAKSYRNVVASHIEAHPGPYQQQQRTLVVTADLSFAIADQYFGFGDATNAKAVIETGLRCLDIALDFTSGISFAKNALVVATGINPITGDHVSNTWRAVIAATLFAPAVISGVANSSIGLGTMFAHIADTESAPLSTLAHELSADFSASDEALAGSGNAISGDGSATEAAAQGVAHVTQEIDATAGGPTNNADNHAQFIADLVDSAKNFVADARTIGGKSLDESTFLKRTVQLSDDTVESGSIRLKQGVGGARYEIKDGITLRTAKAGEEGIDFVNVSSGEKISLKGPYRQNNMDPIPAQAYNPETFAKSALKPNTAVDKVVVDLYGFDAAEKELIKNTIKNGGPTKPIEYLE